MKPEYKKYALIGITAIVLVASGVFILGRRDASKQIVDEEPQIEETIPTVDSSVKVALESKSGSKEVMLSVSGIPGGTESVDYELSYQTAQQGLQGVIGTVTELDDAKMEKKLTLGTCSSGTCVYHQVVGKIKLTLKFNGGYGSKLFEKEFEL